VIFGDLERLLAQLYPHRIPIAIGIVIGGVALLVAARRRGWSGHLRRHPRASVTIVAVALVVGLPVAWVLGSPLFIRTQVQEAGPVVSAVAPLASPGGAQVVLRGAFAGADEFHFGSGEALVFETAPGRHVLRFEAFSVRNGPDLFVYLSPSPDGYAEGSLELGPLKASDGSFNYEIPVGTDVTAFRSAVVWCRAFSVLFATAPFGAV
jgi:hypothetical protein